MKRILQQMKKDIAKEKASAAKLGDSINYTYNYCTDHHEAGQHQNLERWIILVIHLSL